MDNKEKAYETIKLFYPITLICSLLHNWVYLRTMGINVSKLNITVSDILNDSLVWAPPILIMVFCSLMFSALLFRSDKGKTVSQIKSEFKNKKLAYILYDLPIVLMKAIVCISSFVYIIFPQHVSGIPTAALTLSFLFIIDWIISHDKIFVMLKAVFQDNLSRFLTVLLVAPTLIVYSLISGYSDATMDYDSRDVYTIQYSIGKNRNMSDNVIVMRSYEKMSLIKIQSDNSILIANNDTILSINSNNKIIYRYDGIKTLKRVFFGI